MGSMGTSDAAAISCKELFLSTPKHSDFISEKDQGEDIIRCSGWRQPIDMPFINNESYRLAGITSYVESRRHYVGYILHNGHFLYYDGIPATNPGLGRYHGKYIEGDISLLCCFPCEKRDRVVKSMFEPLA